MACSEFIRNINKSIDVCNNFIIDTTTSDDVKYNYVCVFPSVTYQNYFKMLKKMWEQNVKKLEKKSEPNLKSRLIFLIMDYLIENKESLTEENIIKFKNFIKKIKTEKIGDILDDDFFINVVTNIINLKKYKIDENITHTIIFFIKTIRDNCYGELTNILIDFIKNYLISKIGNDVDFTKEDMKKINKNIVSILKNLNITNIYSLFNNIITSSATMLYKLNSFSVGSELDELLPNELGESMKKYFITLLSTYYNNLHPIIWAQILRQMMKNIFIDKPITPKEIYAFMANNLILNSGPFILKTIQMVRPFIDEETQKKYNLTKLTYPLLEENQINMILKKILYNYDLYEIIRQNSASVGHVCFVKNVIDNQIYVIKIIKPVSIAQSCWEYKTLTSIEFENICEREYIKNVLESNGNEMNTQNEIENLIEGHKYYTDNYKNVFGVDLKYEITTIQNIKNIIKDDCWFALTMDVAEGIPLSKLTEDNSIKEILQSSQITAYKTKLHRCLDLLVYKFFYNLLHNGFYHGDLHSGNIFFSYDKNKLTLIDFGATGKLNLLEGDTDKMQLLKIIIMSLFYNFDAIFDDLTDLINNKCEGTNYIDKNSVPYKLLKKKLKHYKLLNIANEKIEENNYIKYINDLNTLDKIEEEKEIIHELTEEENKKNFDSIYSYLDRKQKKQETEKTIIEHRDVIPSMTEQIGASKSITFNRVIKEILEFYAINGVNVIVKVAEFSEFQKAYALLLGVLDNLGYNSYRTRMAMNKMIKNIESLKLLKHPITIAKIIKKYYDEYKNHKKIINLLNNNIKLKKYLMYKINFIKV